MKAAATNIISDYQTAKSALESSVSEFGIALNDLGFQVTLKILSHVEGILANLFITM